MHIDTTHLLSAIHCLDTMQKNAATRLTFGMLIVISSMSGSGAAAPVRDAGAYAQDSSGNHLRTENGLCWRTGYWTPRDAIAGCDGELQSPIGKPTAPDLLPQPGQQAVAVSPLAVPATRRCDFSMTLDSDNTFGFGNDRLTPAGRKRLLTTLQQKIATCGTIESIIVNGHTDRLGNTLLNQRLSERRASAVAAYFIDTDINSKVQVNGLGDTQSITHCPNMRQQAALIRCLAPDRRATIDVRGLSK